MDDRQLSIGSQPAALPEYRASFLLGSIAQVLCFTHSVKRTVFCFVSPLAVMWKHFYVVLCVFLWVSGILWLVTFAQ